MKKTSGSNESSMHCSLCASSMSEIERITSDGEYCILCMPEKHPMSFLSWMSYSLTQYRVHQLKKRFNSNGDKWLFIGVLSELGLKRISDITTAQQYKEVYKHLKDMKR